MGLHQSRFPATYNNGTVAYDEGTTWLDSRPTLYYLITYSLKSIGHVATSATSSTSEGKRKKKKKKARAKAISPLIIATQRNRIAWNDPPSEQPKVIKSALKRHKMQQKWNRTRQPNQVAPCVVVSGDCNSLQAYRLSIRLVYLRISQRKPSRHISFAQRHGAEPQCGEGGCGQRKKKSKTRTSRNTANGPHRKITKAKIRTISL